MTADSMAEQRKVDMSWLIRPIMGGDDEDRRYIVTTWRSSLQTAKEFRNKTSSEFRRVVDVVIDKILDRDDTQVLIANIDSYQTDAIAGWMVFTPMSSMSVVHYIYVRGGRSGNARDMGCASALAEASGVLRKNIGFTFRGPSYDFLRAAYPHAIYIPPNKFLE